MQMVVEHRLKVPTLDELMTQHEDTQEHEDVSPAKVCNIHTHTHTHTD